MSKLIPLNSLNLEQFLNTISNSEITVYENIQGSKIFFQYDGNQIIIKTRNLNSDPINRVDLALQKYYQPVWDYLENLDVRIKKLIPKNWWFACQYFYDEQPSYAKYSKLPKNKLILTAIIKGNRFTFDVPEIIEYANLLSIDPQPIIFHGKLTDAQIQLLTYFLQTSPKDLEYVFGQDNFAHFFYKILNPQLSHSILMTDGEYQNNLDKLIIRVDKNEIAFSILNPLYSQNEPNDTDYVEIYTVLLLQFVEFLQLIDFNRINLKSTTSDEMYLEIISMLFNSFCRNRAETITNFDFIIPPFFQEEKYQINIDKVSNPQTKSWIKKDPKLEYLFKIILSSFRTRKKKVIGVFNDNTLTIFNQMVNAIQKTIDKKIKIERDIKLSSSDLLNFNDYYTVSYSTDANGNVYPDLYKDLSQDISTEKKPFTKK